jgi:alpha-D-xyloside xylohydrolase
MKFTKGYWWPREGVRLLSPAMAYETRVESRSITVYAPVKPIRHRGDTLNCPMLTFRFDSPAPDIIRVRIVHFAGGLERGPRFEIEERRDHPVGTREDGKAAELVSGRTSVRIAKTGDWAVEFFDGGRRLTGAGPKHTAYILDADGSAYFREQLDLSVGESIYGLGERFTPLVRNGQSVDLWNEDGGTCSELAYKNVPFFVSSRGYGVWTMHPEKVSYEVASEVVSRVQFSVPGEELEYCLVGGGSMKAALSNYTALSGRPALPPAWSFGLWLTTSFTTSYDESTIHSFIDGMRQRGVPLHVFHFDCFWMKEFQWCDFEWQSATFPDPVENLKSVKAKGLRVCVWINPYIGQKSRLFEEGHAKGYLVKRPDGSTWQWDFWQAGMGLVDFTNPAAVAWYQGALRKLLREGVDCFKTDFGERIPLDVDWSDGSDPLKMHNYYAYLYNKAVFEVLEEEKGVGNALVFARSATSGGQKFPVHWGGDCSATYASMAETLRGGLSLGLSGFGFWSHDISGFELTATPDLYKRWVAFGLLSSHSRLHGNESYRVPWLYDEEAVDVLRSFTRLKCGLMPYLFAQARKTVDTGLPMMRAMALEFPDDPAAATLDRQYMLGDNLLVAPIFGEDGRVTWYVPEGRWTHFLNGRVIEGPRWVTETFDYFSLPLFARPSSIIAVGGTQDRPDYDYADGPVFHVFEPAEGEGISAELRSMDGSPEFVLRVTRRGRRLEAAIEAGQAPAPRAWSLLLRGIPAIASASAGTVTSGPLGTLVALSGGLDHVRVEW